MSSPKAEPLLRLGITVDGERDPDPADDQLCFAAAVVERGCDGRTHSPDREPMLVVR